MRDVLPGWIAGYGGKGGVTGGWKVERGLRAQALGTAVNVPGIGGGVFPLLRFPS